MQRILIIGQPGSGKSTLSYMLSQNLALSRYDGDRLLRNINGIDRTPDEFSAELYRASNTPRWVMDSNKAVHHAAVRERADTLIWLDYKPTLVFARYASRSISRLLDGEHLNGDKRSPQDGLLQTAREIYWAANSFIQNRTVIRRSFSTACALAAQSPGKQVLHLTSPAHTSQFLISLGIAPVPNRQQRREARNITPQS